MSSVDGLLSRQVNGLRRACGHAVHANNPTTIYGRTEEELDALEKKLRAKPCGGCAAEAWGKENGAKGGHATWGSGRYRGKEVDTNGEYVWGRKSKQQLISEKTLENLRI